MRREAKCRFWVARQGEDRNRPPSCAGLDRWRVSDIGHDRGALAVDITVSSRVVHTRRGGRRRPFVPVAGPAGPAAARERVLGPNLRAN